MVGISVVSAFFVGVIFMGGLGAMWPILRVLLNNDTLSSWMDRQVIETQLGVTMSDDQNGRIIRVANDGPAKTAGVKDVDRVLDLQKAAQDSTVDVQTQ